MFRTTTLRRSSSSPVYARHRVRSPTNNRKQRHDHERCWPRAQIPWYVVKNLKIVEVATWVAKARKEIGTRVCARVRASDIACASVTVRVVVDPLVVSSDRTAIAGDCDGIMGQRIYLRISISLTC